MPQDRLVRLIQEYSEAHLTCRQVAKRLRELLPTRLAEIRRQKPQPRAAARMRAALTDPNYLKSLDELLTLQHEAREARMQYETHLMLVYARQTMRAFARR